MRENRGWQAEAAGGCGGRERSIEREGEDIDGERLLAKWLSCDNSQRVDKIDSAIASFRLWRYRSHILQPTHPCVVE